MLPFTKIDHPLALPYACVGCGMQLGPFVDTKREIRGYGSVIVCAKCAKTIAEQLGFAPGKKLDELSKAVKREAELEREIDGLRQGTVERDDRLSRLTRHNQALEEQNKQLIGRVEQLQQRFRDEAKAALELVGGEAA